MSGILAFTEVGAIKRYYVFSVAHGVVSQDEAQQNAFVEHRDIRLLLLQPNYRQLSVTEPATYIELPWTRCFHTAHAYYAAATSYNKFTFDCSVFELISDQLSEEVKARAAALFDYEAATRPTRSLALGTSFVPQLAPPEAGEGRDESWLQRYVEVPVY